MTETEQPVSADQKATAPEPLAAEVAPQQEQITLAPPAAANQAAAQTEPKVAEPAVAAPARENIVEPKPEEIKAEKINPPTDEEKMSPGTIVGIIIVLIAVLALIFYATRQPATETAAGDEQTVKVSGSPEPGKVNIIEETKNDINVQVANSDRPAYPQVKIMAYLGNTQKNPGSADCSLTYPLERQIDQKYDSNLINTMLGLLQPLTVSEKEQGYVSAIPGGTLLKYLKLDDSGVMSVNLTGNISQAAGSCAVTAIKAQITDTLSQFAAVKSVVICIDGNCDAGQILQP